MKQFSIREALKKGMNVTIDHIGLIIKILVAEIGCSIALFLSGVQKWGHFLHFAKAREWCIMCAGIYLNLISLC